MNARIKIILIALAVMTATASVVVIVQYGFAWTNPGGTPPNGSAAITTVGGNIGVGVSPDSNYRITTSGGGLKAESITQPAGYFNSSSGYGLIVNDGNVGIGTATPRVKLSVSGNVVSARGAILNGMVFCNGGVTFGATYFTCADPYVRFITFGEGIQAYQLSATDTAAQNFACYALHGSARYSSVTGAGTPYVAYAYIQPANGPIMWYRMYAAPATILNCNY